MKTDLTIRRLHAVFTGRVQGVGFRYTTCRYAENYSIVGQVKNLADGSVELIAEGPEDELYDFLKAIRTSRIGSHIFNEQIAWKNPANEFDRFGISYS